MPARTFWNTRIHLSERNNLVYFGDRVIIPDALRQDVLDSLHLAHQGVTAMILRAQSSFFGLESRQIYRERETHASAAWSQHHRTAPYRLVHR